MNIKNVREAIKFMKEEIDYKSYVAMNGRGEVYEAKTFEKEVNQVIGLLERCEKLENVVQDLEEFEIDQITDVPDEYLQVRGGTMKYIIKIIKEKYFPKLIKKAIVVEMEASEEEVKHCIDFIKAFALFKPNFSKDAKMNVKEIKI